MVISALPIINLASTTPINAEDVRRKSAALPAKPSDSSNSDLPSTPRPYLSGVAVHKGSARGACSFGSDSLSESLYHVHRRQAIIPQI